MNKGQTNRLLGYPVDARLLIINADDFGMCHSINEAIFRTLTRGLVRSASLMVPCPWALHAMRLLKENPDISFAVHLTVICETVDYKWGPLTATNRVPSLVDEAGHFYHHERMDELLAQARLDELEMEFTAQIERVLDAGLKPTHLDWHCLPDGGRDDICDLMFDLAKQYRLALRLTGQRWIDSVQSQGLPANDHDLLDSFSLGTVDKSARYAKLLSELPAGLSEWAVHPGFDSPELRTINPIGRLVRQTDFDFLISQEAQDIVQQEGIILVDYRALQALWNSPAASGSTTSRSHN